VETSVQLTVLAPAVVQVVLVVGSVTFNAKAEAMKKATAEKARIVLVDGQKESDIMNGVGNTAKQCREREAVVVKRRKNFATKPKVKQNSAVLFLV